MNEEQRRARLIAWLEKIYREVQDLLIDDHIFRELQRLIADNPRFKDVSGLFAQWMASNFIKATAVGVRRHAKADDDSISMKRFLDEIEAYPSLVSRAHYMSLFGGADPQTKEIGEHDFDNLAGAGVSQIPLALVQKQKADLAQAVHNIEHYVDRRIAHHDKRELARPIPALGDMSNALAVLDTLVVLYWRLLKGPYMSTLLPAIAFDWQDIFQFQWARPPAASGEIT
jgi:hypothetical protein